MVLRHTTIDGIKSCQHPSRNHEAYRRQESELSYHFPTVQLRKNHREMEALQPCLPLWRNSEPGVADHAQTRKSIHPLIRTNKKGLHVQLRITDPDTHVSPHFYRHMNPTLCADVSASFELDSSC